MNKVILTGRIATDLEPQKTTSNKTYVRFNLAVNRGSKDANGNYIADFLPITAWEQRADFLTQYAFKGVMISVIGRAETNSYTDKNGSKRKDTFITAEQVEILSKPTSSPEPKQNVEVSPEELPFY